MPEDAEPSPGLSAFADSLARAAKEAETIEQLLDWFQSRDDVVSVRLEDHLVKTYPPLREFVVEIRSGDRSVTTKVADVSVLGDNVIELCGLHDP